ncbi:histidinol-phosphate transaminase [Nitratidesulfovibrio liaohensis]|uniref:Histidinol-phosphate aminotransferase n=1 Tax=Nitratidesulfovibrio liaohensis TaxID=2604158 RepID=A0ABY9R5B8_9BACT|nr:histidinol-phosphate transaminase [Nitratidesulfovibrio liaohensis]WMW66920.1 histidinol-phosphate transaminase [Nitratidesulfovibrio liaohensis]
MCAFERLVPEHVRRFEAYTPSRPDHELMRMYRVDHLHRLNNNENPLGPPPEAARIVRGFPPERVPIYPNGDAWDLRRILAGRFGLAPEQFVVGNGSCELISSVIKAFCTTGDSIVTADKTFAVYEWVAEFSGVEARLIPLRDFGFDGEGMLAARDARTKILFVCNPNNPTGTWWDTATLTRFLDRVNGEQIVVLDEAYAEYVDRHDFPHGIGLLDRYPNLVIFRTFSKMYALAGLRIGYLCGTQEVVDIIRRTHVVYSVNALAQQAAAAALHDDAAFIRQTREMVREGKGLLRELCDDLGLDMQCGEGNYVMIRVPEADTLIYRKLMARGIMIRTMTGFRFPGWIRVSVVQTPVMEEFRHALRAVVGGRR